MERGDSTCVDHVGSIVKSGTPRWIKPAVDGRFVHIDTPAVLHVSARKKNEKKESVAINGAGRLFIAYC